MTPLACQRLLHSQDWGLKGPAGFITILECRRSLYCGWDHRTGLCGPCPGSQQHLQCDVCGIRGVCEHTGAGAGREAWETGTGLCSLHSHPFKLNMNRGPWKPCVVIFQAANVLDGTHGVPPPLAHSCLLFPAQVTCAHTSVWQVPNELWPASGPPRPTRPIPHSLTLH